MYNNRQPNTSARGGAFDTATINLVWSKAQMVPGYDPSVTRKDSCGMWIQRAAYGQTTQYGWEVDHQVPVARGGTDDLANLQPLQWQNNRHKADNYPIWSCLLGG